MTRIVIVPNNLRDAINAKLDAALALVPDAAKDREHLYGQLLAHFDEHGVLPDFQIQRSAPKACPKCGAPVDSDEIAHDPRDSCRYCCGDNLREWP
jgi:hypothetical protein